MGSDFDAPPFIIGQMEMQLIDFVVSEQVYITFHMRQIDPRARHVEHHAPVTEPGAILDGAAIQPHGKPEPSGIHVVREELKQGLHTVEHAAVSAARDLDPPGGDAQHIRFGGQRLVGAQDHTAVGGAAGCRATERNVRRDVSGERLQRGFAAQRHAAVEQECSVGGRVAPGNGQQLGAGSGEAQQQGEQGKNSIHGAEICLLQRYFFPAK